MNLFDFLQKYDEISGNMRIKEETDHIFKP